VELALVLGVGDLGDQEDALLLRLPAVATEGLDPRVLGTRWISSMTVRSLKG